MHDNIDSTASGQSITTAIELEKVTGISLTREEREWFSAGGELPFLVTPYYAGLIDPENPGDPIRRQCIPRIQETCIQSYELDDPLGENSYMPVDGLIHRYPSRALFISSTQCATYCRHCFRRRVTGKPAGKVGGKQVQTGSSAVVAAAEYLSRKPEVRELLISGGDALMLSVDRLREMLSIFRSFRPDLVLRICSRVPVVAPGTVSASLVEMLASFRGSGIYLITQYNHPRELSDGSTAAVSLFVDAGIPVLNQSVLLKGVNDSLPVLEELCNKLVMNRIVPYYLFQLDMAAGTAHFRVALARGLRLHEGLRHRVSSLAYPAYVVDIPGGGGKVNLAAYGIKGQSGSIYILENSEGTCFTYIDPGEIK